MQPGTVIEQPIEDEMKRAYLSYAMSVIVGRALPDVRDGLKPVHRRILHAMNEMGMSPDKPYRKCARVVGEVLGKFHPHGDTAVYDSLVRMAQLFSMRLPLVDGQGNFGSMDGDNAAAMRYTECRLAPAATELLADIESETVPFVPNFDASLEEPSLLPARIPNLLVNGSTGIAVGMSTNMPPHNLTEAIDAILLQLQDPAVSLATLMDVLPGPDFPTGGIVLGKAGVRDAYETGRGQVRLRALIDTEAEDKPRLIVREIPYMVNKAELIQDIARLVRERVLEGISDLRDESDISGVRVVIELRRDASPEMVVNQLYKHTRLETTFAILNLALVNSRPEVLSLKQLIHHFIQHRLDVITRRTQHLLRKAQERAHIVEGLILALDNLDAVIALIRGSADSGGAKQGLIQRFRMSEEQAKAVLEMRLSRLAQLEQRELRQELEELRAKIADLQDILAREERRKTILRQELVDAKERFPMPRLTKFQVDPGDIRMEDVVPDEPAVITRTKRGYVKRTALEEYRKQHRGGKGIRGAGAREEDEVIDALYATTHAHLLVFTNQGRVYALRGWHIPEGSRSSKGTPIVQLLTGLQPGEQPQNLIHVQGFDTGTIIFATRKGLVKRTALNEYQNVRSTGIWAIKLEEGDGLVNVKYSDGSNHVVLVSSAGQAVRFDEAQARAMGRHTVGVKGMTVEGDEAVVALELVKGPESVMTITANGYGKRTAVSDYPLHHRGGKGVRVAATDDASGPVVAVLAAEESDEILVFTREGQSIRAPAAEAKAQGRATRGVRFMRLEPGDQVVAAVRLPKDESEATESPAGEPPSA